MTRRTIRSSVAILTHEGTGSSDAGMGKGSNKGSNTGMGSCGVDDPAPDSIIDCGESESSAVAEHTLVVRMEDAGMVANLHTEGSSKIAAHMEAG